MGKLVKRAGTITYKEKGKNVGMPLEKNRKVRGLGAGRVKRKARK